jgi:hypothetical protein
MGLILIGLGLSLKRKVRSRDNSAMFSLCDEMAEIIVLILIVSSFSLTPLLFLKSPKVLRHGIWYSLGDLNANFTLAQIQLWNGFKLYHQIGINDIFVLTKSSEGYFLRFQYIRQSLFEWDALKLAYEIANHFNLSIMHGFALKETLSLRRLRAHILLFCGF